MIKLERAQRPGKPGWGSIAHRVAVLSLIAVAILAILGPLSTAGRAQQAPGQLYDVRANQTTTADQHEPTLAVDPTNPNIVLAASKDWRTGPKQVWYYRSTDGGKTWADGHIDTFPTELPNQSDPVIAFDANGGAYMAVLGYNQNDLTIGGLFISRSLDKGATWQTPVLVSSNDDQIFNDKEWLTVDRSSAPTRGNIYTSWTLFTKTGPRTERGDIVVSRSTDGGQTFSKRVVASLPSQSNSQGSYPVVGPNGELYVLYYNGTGALDEDEGEREGEAGGEGASTSGASQAAYQSQAADNALYVAKSTDGGQTFPQVKRAATVVTPRSPLPGSQFRIFVLPTLAIDPKSAALYATWNDYAAGDTDTMIVRSTDGGITWSEPVRVNDDPVAP